MRVLILNTDYLGFLRWHYGRYPDLRKANFARQTEARARSLFGVANFYSSSFRELGHEALDIHVNNPYLQMAWAHEYDVEIQGSMLTNARASLDRMVSKTPLARATAPLFDPLSETMRQILKAQVAHYRPDLILNQTMDGLPGALIRELKDKSHLIVGQHAALSLPASEDLSAYDLVVSSFPKTIGDLKLRGVKTRLQRLAFHPPVLETIGDPKRDIDVSFVGSFFDVHRSRFEWLESVIAKLASEGVSVSVWGDQGELPIGSRVLSCHHGPAWGADMYLVMARSRITLNHHGNVAAYANNLRLYEATGMGALLVTDSKPNLHEIFEIGSEIVDYSSADDCCRQILRYIKDESTREEIARAGQARTITEHTFKRRVQELLEMIGESASQ